MRYQAQIKGRKQPVEVDVERLGPGRFSVVMGGQRHEVDAYTLDHGAVSLLNDGDSYNVEFDEQGDEVIVLLRNQAVTIGVLDERRQRLRAGRAGFTAEGRQVISAPMPGKVVKVLVKVGDQVAEGQGLIIVEAMKMENELKSPKAGKVVELHATEGKPVEQNAKLVVVD